MHMRSAIGKRDRRELACKRSVFKFAVERERTKTRILMFTNLILAVKTYVEHDGAMFSGFCNRWVRDLARSG